MATTKVLKHVLIAFVTSTSLSYIMAQGEEMQLDTEPLAVPETLNVKDSKQTTFVSMVKTHLNSV